MPETLRVTGRIIVREKAIVAGCRAAVEVFRRVDPSVDAQIIRRRHRSNHGRCDYRSPRMARSILKAERVALNFCSACGIATLTRQFVDAIRKLPRQNFGYTENNSRAADIGKSCVVAGGGANHRFGLYDMVLVKDNHLTTFEGLSSFADRFASFARSDPTFALKWKLTIWNKCVASLKLRV